MKVNVKDTKRENNKRPNMVDFRNIKSVAWNSKRRFGI
jgi:hypothetical protein